MTGAAAPAVSPRRKQAPASPLTVPPRPRRVSGPARRGVTERPVRGRPDEYRGIAPALIAAFERLSHHRWLGGRAWIAFVAFALIGIVTMQLGLLKLNAGIGRALEHEALLQRENAALSIENSELSGSGHILSLASRLGMAPVPAGAVHFLRARPVIDVRLGAAALSAPAHAPAATSAEPSPETQAVSREQPTTEAGTTAPSGESSGGASAASAASPEASAGESPRTQGSGESSGTTSGVPAAPSGESSHAPGAPPSTPAAPAGGSAEGTPAGGTQAGSSG